MNAPVQRQVRAADRPLNRLLCLALLGHRTCAWLSRIQAQITVTSSESESEKPAVFLRVCEHDREDMVMNVETFCSFLERVIFVHGDDVLETRAPSPFRLQL